MVKINGSGDQLWDKVFYSYDEDFLQDMIPTPDGGYLLAGYTGAHGSNEYPEDDLQNINYWVIKGR